MLEKCPSCSTSTMNLLRTWTTVFPSKDNKNKLKFTVGLYECAMCEKKLHVLLGKERITLHHAIKEIEEVRENVKTTLKSLHEKFEQFKRQQLHLILEIEKRKITGEQRAETLKEEIQILKREAASLQKLIEKNQRPK